MCRVPRGGRMLAGAFLLDAAGAFFSSGRFSTVSVTAESSSESMSGVVGPPAPQDWTSPCLAGLCCLHPHPPCCRGSRRPRPGDAGGLVLEMPRSLQASARCSASHRVSCLILSRLPANAAAAFFFFLIN